MKINIFILFISLLIGSCSQPRSYTPQVVNKPVVQTVSTIKPTYIDGTRNNVKPSRVYTTPKRTYLRTSRSFTRLRSRR